MDITKIKIRADKVLDNDGVLAVCVYDHEAMEAVLRQRLTTSEDLGTALSQLAVWASAHRAVLSPHEGKDAGKATARLAANDVTFHILEGDGVIGLLAVETGHGIVKSTRRMLRQLTSSTQPKPKPRVMGRPPEQIEDELEVHGAPRPGPGGFLFGNRGGND